MLQYATGGGRWYSNADWLSYDVDEYDWYRSFFLTSSLFDDDFYPDWLDPYTLLPQESEDLSHVWLFNNNLVEALPEELYLLTGLRTLDLAGNKLTGSISSKIGDIEPLWFFTMFSNVLTGSIPSEVGRLSSLIGLSNLQNKLTGQIPSELGSISNLWITIMDGNNLSGTFPTELGLLSNQVLMRLEDNQVAGKYRKWKKIARQTSFTR